MIHSNLLRQEKPTYQAHCSNLWLRSASRTWRYITMICKTCSLKYEIYEQMTNQSPTKVWSRCWTSVQFPFHASSPSPGLFTSQSVVVYFPACNTLIKV